tara:strand:- start:44 stop:703 length:660 start_codon:yes stop_codon:yes gene_type:complete
MKKVISFSVYGDNPKYTIGLIRNLDLIKEIYPNWTTYVYFNNTVPSEIIDEVNSFENVETFDMSELQIPGMFWRFQPNDDENVERFVIRDTDSRVTEREKVAVYEWIEDNKVLHIMRDHPHHNYPILGGMWGMKCENTFNMKEEFINYTDSKELFEKMTDMNFLRDIVYPKFSQDSTVHASYHGYEPWAKEFTSPLIDKRFIGEIINEDESREYHYTLI